MFTMDSTPEKKSNTIPAAYTSVWDGMEITSPCQLDPETGVLSKIEDSGLPECVLASLQTLEQQYVTVHGRQYPVRENDDGELAAERTYGVFVSRNGYCQVQATSCAEASRIVDKDFKIDEVSWDDDWHPTDVQLEEEISHGESV